MTAPNVLTPLNYVIMQHVKTKTYETLQAEAEKRPPSVEERTNEPPIDDLSNLNQSLYDIETNTQHLETRVNCQVKKLKDGIDELRSDVNLRIDELIDTYNNEHDDSNSEANKHMNSPDTDYYGSNDINSTMQHPDTADEQGFNDTRHLATQNRVQPEPSNKLRRRSKRDVPVAINPEPSDNSGPSSDSNEDPPKGNQNQNCLQTEEKDEHRL